jgi:hypothetical protein
MAGDVSVLVEPFAQVMQGPFMHASSIRIRHRVESVIRLQPVIARRWQHLPSSRHVCLH